MPKPITGRGKGWRLDLIDTPDGPMTRKEAAQRSGLPLGTIARRVWQGWPTEHLFDPVARHQYRPRKPGERRVERLYETPRGRLTLAEIAAALGITPKAMHTRLTVYGWSEEKAFTTPKHGARSSTVLTAEYRRRFTA